MELVEGITLQKKIEGGRLPVKEALAYALQIGEALQEAHSKGIVHRDVKAENIMVTARNQIKVMDFGLAKLKGSIEAHENVEYGWHGGIYGSRTDPGRGSGRTLGYLLIRRCGVRNADGSSSIPG